MFLSRLLFIFSGKCGISSTMDCRGVMYHATKNYDIFFGTFFLVVTDDYDKVTNIIVQNYGVFIFSYLCVL